MVERRDALKALAALPGVACVERLEIKPDQVLVFKSKRRLRAEEVQRIRDLWTKLRSEMPGFPPAIILEDGLDLAVLERKEGGA